MTSARPRSITILGWLFLAVGAGGLLAGSYRYVRALSASAGGLDRHETLDYVYAASSQILALVGGAFLLAGRDWARWVLVVWMAAHLVLSAVHSAEQLLVHCALLGERRSFSPHALPRRERRTSDPSERRVVPANAESRWHGMRGIMPARRAPRRQVMRKMLWSLLPAFLFVSTLSAQLPAPAQGDFVVKDFRFASGETIPELRLHYRTLGKVERDAQGVARNAVLVLHGTTGSGANFLGPEFGGELFVAGGLLDVERTFVILPDGIGHGQSSKPSDGLHARFPRYGYVDMVEAQHRLVTEGLGVNHLRLVMGTSMGGMHTWVWGERYPEFMDALMPLASLPTQISGRNRVWRRVVIDAIRNDPGWRGGEYAEQPQGLRVAEEMLFFMGSNPLLRQASMPTLAESDKVLDAAMERALKSADANDVLYQVEASRDYDPGPDLGKIRAPLLAINFADDLINPPELGILEREIQRVPKGRAIVIPAGPETRGHGTHTLAKVWKQHLEELLKSTTR